MPKKKVSKRFLQCKKAAESRWKKHRESSEQDVTDSNSTRIDDYDPAPSSSLPSTSSELPLQTASTSRQIECLPSTSTAPSPPHLSSMPSPSHLSSTPSQHSLQQPHSQQEELRSHKKIALYTQYHGDLHPTCETVRTITEIEQLEKLISVLGCPECASVGGLSLKTTKQYGLSLQLKVICTECNKSVSTQYTSSRNTKSTSTPQPFLINEASTFASLLAGMGAYSFKNFCEYLEIPGLHQKTFNSIAKRIYDKNDNIGDEVFHQAAFIVRQEHRLQYNIELNEESPLDIAVCFDGSWLTRGHKSLIGIGSVIDVLTGLILDIHVLSLHCNVCAQTGDWIRRENPQRYDRWKAEHIESGECTINFDGTSGMMEVKAAEVLWCRSVEKHNMRYTTMVSDGDSKSFNHLLKLQPYGSETIIEKEDCLNHVGKRMGTALRSLVADCSKKGITLGGRGQGRLTADAIRKLQIYYSRAIRSNSTAEEMRRAILASIYHGYSTDDLPQHQYCPPGPKSWCFFKRQIGEHRYPTGHKKRIHTPLEYNRLHKHLEPIYTRLSSLDLLKRCERKATQNPSESFHHSVWSRVSKKNFHSKKRVEFAVISAAAEYNRGPAAISSLKEHLGLGVGQYGHRFGAARRQKRLAQEIMEVRQQSKSRRKKRSEAKEKARAEKEAEEGGPAYQPGMF